MSERDERLVRTVAALEVLVAALAKQAKAGNPDFEAEALRMVAHPAPADGASDKTVKDAVSRLLSA